MKPKANAIRLMSAVRATAKMHELRAEAEDFVAIPRNPQILFSQAIGILGDAAAAFAENFINPAIADGRPQTWNDGDGSTNEMIRFSATFFDAYLEARLQDEITSEFSLLCAAAYYLSDSVGSAMVVVKQSSPPELELGHGLARLAYSILKNDFSGIEGDFRHATFAGLLIAALQQHFTLEVEALAIVELCQFLRDEVYENGSARELFYADIVTALCAKKLRNSARNIIPVASGLPLEMWATALRKSHFPIELWPAQQRICNANLLLGNSAVIQMPTSAGKTRATEMIIRSLFLSRRSSLAVIVAPFRSLCHDIRSDLAKAFAGENINLDEVSDSFLLDVDLVGVLAQNSVLIVTPEKMLYMLRRAPELAESIGLIIYDEGHQFDGLSRGPTYELLLSSLRMTLSPATQIVLISAVIGNANQIAGWLLRNENAVIDGHGLLPTAKSIAFASWQHERGWLQYVHPEDPEESEFFVPRVIDSLPLTRTSNRERVRVFPERDRPQDNSESAEVGLYLGLHLVGNGSVALFCGQKSSVTKICRRVVEIFDRDVQLERPVNVSNAREIGRLAFLTRAHAGDNSEAGKAADLGVLGHHANTPHGLRLSIEHAMKEGLARFVVCTSTLAQGVNFPIKYLIVTATQQGAEKIKVRDFHNLMGRAGRAGMYTEGSVIFSSPNIYDERRHADKRWRWQAVKDLLDPNMAEPSRSSILQIFDDYNQIAPPIIIPLDAAWLNLAFANHAYLEEIVELVVRAYPVVNAAEFKKFAMIRAKAVQSIAAYLAAYVDFDSDLASDRVDELAANTLAYNLADDVTRTKLLEVFRATAKALEDNADADFRALIRKSPLPPAEVLEIRDWIAVELENLRQAMQDGNLFEVIIAKLLPYVRSKAVNGISHQNLIIPALRSWINGDAFHIIKKPLNDENARIGGKKISIEHTVAMCEGGFGYELSMIIASASDLLESVDVEISNSLSLFQRQIKNGLSNESALVFLEAGFADRVVAQALAERFPEVTNKASVKQICRNRRVEINEVLGHFPSYFAVVAAELSST